jgi:hypothetical protein
MSNLEASQEVIEHAAQACANKLTKLFGSIDGAIAAIEADPVTMAQIAMSEFIKDQRKMTLAAHMNPRAFARVVLSQAKA